MSMDWIKRTFARNVRWRLLDFMSAVPPPPSPPPPRDPPDLNCKRYIAVFPSGPEQQAQSGAEWFLPDLHCKRLIAVFPAGPEQQAQDQWSCRTSAASARSQCSPLDPNSKLRIRVFPAGPELQTLDRSAPRRTRTASSGSEWSPPDLNCKR